MTDPDQFTSACRSNVAICLPPFFTDQSIRFLPVMPSCTAAPIAPSTTHAIDTHFGWPGAGANGYRIHTPLAEGVRRNASPLPANAVRPMIGVHAPTNPV